MTKKRGYLRVLLRNFHLFRKSGALAISWIFLEPLLYLFAFGFGLGTFIQNMNEVSFLDYFYPGLLLTTAALVAFQESTQSQFSRLKEQNLYETWLLMPLQTQDIFWGEVLWATIRGTASAVGVAVAGSVLGLYQGWGYFAGLLPAIMLAILFSFIGTWLVTYARRSDFFYFPLTGFIIPIIFISGVIFPIETLPLPLQLISYVFPIAHAVELTRSLIEQRIQVIDLIHLIYVIFLIGFWSRLAAKRFYQKLTA